MLIPILHFQVMHNYMCFIAPKDFCVEWKFISLNAHQISLNKYKNRQKKGKKRQDKKKEKRQKKKKKKDKKKKGRFGECSLLTIEYQEVVLLVNESDQEPTTPSKIKYPLPHYYVTQIDMCIDVKTLDWSNKFFRYGWFLINWCFLQQQTFLNAYTCVWLFMLRIS